MKRQRAEQHVQKIHTWTYEEAKTALPYLGSIVRSLREHRLDALAHDRAARRLAEKPGRPDRAAMIAQDEAAAEAQRAAERFEASLDELNAIDVYCLDPIRGQALVPFVHGEQLAWYVFDVFDGEDLRSWRFHDDPLETRRPVAELEEEPVAPAVA